MENLDKIKDLKYLNQLTEYGIKIGSAILVLIIGHFIIKIIMKLCDGIMSKNKMDATLQSFIKSAISISLKIMIVPLFAFKKSPFLNLGLSLPNIITTELSS